MITLVKVATMGVLCLCCGSGLSGGKRVAHGRSPLNFTLYRSHILKRNAKDRKRLTYLSKV